MEPTIYYLHFYPEIVFVYEGKGKSKVLADSFEAPPHYLFRSGYVKTNDIDRIGPLCRERLLELPLHLDCE